MNQLTKSSRDVKTYPTLTIHFPNNLCLDNFICRLDNVFDRSIYGEEDVLYNESNNILYSLGKSRLLFKDEEENLNSDHRPRGTQYLMYKGDLFEHRLNNTKPETVGEAKMLDPYFLSNVEKELLIREAKF